MSFYGEDTCKRVPRFRPTLEGCVAKDLHLVGAVERCYVDAFASIAACVYRSLVTENVNRAFSNLFEELAEEDMEQFRLLGELLMALGGDAAIRGFGRQGDCRRARQMPVESILAECIAQRTRNIDRYETLMSRTGDRVVRSIFAKLLSGERMMRGRLEGFLKE